MKTFIIGMVGAAALLMAVPASAQDVGVRVGNVGVHLGDRDHDRDRDIRVRRDHDRRIGFNEYGCKRITVKKRMPDGSVVIKKSTRC